MQIRIRIFRDTWERDKFRMKHARFINRLLWITGKGMCPSCGTYTLRKGKTLPTGEYLPFNCGTSQPSGYTQSPPPR